MSKPTRFCMVNSCENAKGTSSEDVLFFCPPSEKGLYYKWMHAIGQHQDVQGLGYICDRHFKPHNIQLRGKSKLLDRNAVPTIFDTDQDEIPDPLNIENVLVDLIDENMCEPQINIQSDSTMDFDSCQRCIDREMDVQQQLSKLKHNLFLQTSLVDYWKSIALKYEPDHKEPFGQLKKKIKFKEAITQTDNSTFPLEPQETSSTEILEIKQENIVYIKEEAPVEDCAVTNNEDNNTTVVSLSILKPFQCGECDERFEDAKQLSAHLKEERIIKGPDKSKCKVCGKKFHRRINLYKHMLRTHNVSALECPVCSQIFTRQFSLDRHLKKQH